MKLSVIIVNYNVKHYIAQCVDSVFCALGGTPGIDGEVVVVDNHSNDHSCSYLRHRFGHDSRFSIIENIHNLGFAKANNIGIRQSQGDYVLLLNPDTVVAEETLRMAIDFMDSHPQAGGLGVCMHNEDGSPAMESRRGIPTPATAFYKMSGLCARFPRSRRFGRYYMSCLPWDEPQQIEIISGAFCMLRRRALDQTGLLDETFFMYGEDVDLSYRLLQAGWENWYLPAHILHYKGESTKKSSFRYVHVFYQAMLIFFKKHYGERNLLLTLPIQMAIYVRAFMALCSMLMQRMRKSLGFLPVPEKVVPHYVFLATADHLDLCRRIARKHGLNAHFVQASAETLPDGHLKVGSEGGLSADEKHIVIYDSSAYTYSDILRIFATCPKPSVSIGFFHPKEQTVITPREIII